MEVEGDIALWLPTTQLLRLRRVHRRSHRLCHSIVAEAIIDAIPDAALVPSL